MSAPPSKPFSDSFSRLADELPEIVVRYDLDCRRIYINKAYERVTNNRAEDVIGTHVDTSWVPDTPLPEYLQRLKHTLKTGETEQFQLQITTPSGQQIYQQVTFLPEWNDNGEIIGALAISYDITALIQTQNTLRESEEKFRVLFEGANDGISLQEQGSDDQPGPFIEVNEALCKALGYSREELLAMTALDIIHPDYREITRKYLPTLLAEGAEVFESVQYTKDGRSIPVEVSVRILEMQGKRFLFAIARDISERKQAELEMMRINRYLRTLSRCNETLVQATDEKQLLHAMCRITVTNGEFPLAWIGYLTEDQHLRVAASYGVDANHFLDEKITVNQAPNTPERPTVTAIKTGITQIVQNIATSETPPQWKERALERGLGSAISLPLQVNSKVIGSFNIYLPEPEGFDPQVTLLLSELADDIAFGIHSLRVRADREHFMARLQASMSSTIHALSNTVELRDPYTAGHQRRVAQLARAVAQHLGYSEEQVELIYLAGVVHDIGKIAVPSEILSRPGRLSENEMMLARTHVDASYNILKSVDFPWPIADIVHQHHERLDGSGYPLGLKGEGILREARILAVCDVVEAMTTHRPYRPGLGVDAALAEIERGKGTLYDSSVADACFQVMRDGFTFDD